MEIRVDRRTTLKWVLAASASLAVGAPAIAVGAPSANSSPTPGTPGGYGTDPDLLKTYHPGDLWPLTLSVAQRQLAAALCDVIIPADDKSPSASAVGVVDFIDEWISAPYDRQKADRAMILEGLTQLDGEAMGRFKKSFANLSVEEQRAL